MEKARRISMLAMSTAAAGIQPADMEMLRHADSAATGTDTDKDPMTHRLTELSTTNTETTTIDEGKASDAETQLPPRPPPQRSRLRIALLVLALCLINSLAALDTTIVTTSLAAIARALKASDALYAWVGSGYLLGNLAVLPVWVRASDVFGRKGMLLMSCGLFFAGSAVSGAARDGGVLVVGRVVQGVGAGGMTALAEIVVADVFSPRERGMYLGLIALSLAAATAGAPLLGGFFAEHVTWRWCFYINLPMTGCAIIWTALFLDVHQPRTQFWEGVKAIDWIGVGACLVATTTTLTALSLGGLTYPWVSVPVITLLVVGGLAFAFFTLSQCKISRRPILPPHIFSNPSNAAALAIAFFHGFGVVAAGFFLPLYFQLVLGASPLQSGTWLLIFAMSMITATFTTGVILQKTGLYRPIIWVSECVSVLGFALFITFPPYRSWARLATYQIALGFGVGPLFHAPLLAVQARISPRDVATANGSLAAARMLGTTLSIVVGQAVLQNSLRMAVEALPLSALGARHRAAILKGSLVAGSSGLGGGGGGQREQAEIELLREILAGAMGNVWGVCLGVTVLGLVVSGFISHVPLLTETVEHQTGVDTVYQRQAKESRRDFERLSH